MSCFTQRFIMKFPLFLGMIFMLATYSSFNQAATTHEFEVLQSLGKQEGGPNGKLILDASGNLYGTTRYGGSYGRGTVYKIDPTGNYRVLHSFDGINGLVPESGVIQGGDGKLYGITRFGGNDFGVLGNAGYGTIFQLDISGATPVFTVLHKFGTVHVGGYPTGEAYPTDFILGKDNKFYGSTTSDLTFDQGFIFQLDISGPSPVYTVLHSLGFGYFNFVNGSATGLIQGSDRKLYGTTRYFLAEPVSQAQDGVVFQLDISGAAPVYTIVHKFGFAFDGILSEGSDGKLYGTASRWRGYPGILFQIDTSGNTPAYNTLYSFDGAIPSLNVIRANDGRFYGMTSNAIYQLDLSGAIPAFVVLHTFDVTDSGSPISLIQGSGNTLYGIASTGKDGGAGEVFQLDHSNSAAPVYKVLHKWDAAFNVSFPSEFIQGSDGSFYGTTISGGRGGKGTVFQFDNTLATPATKNLYAFGLTNDDGMPDGLLQGNDGKLYGNIGTNGINGGARPAGIFQLDISGFTPLYKKVKGDGYSGQSTRFIQSKDGNLYGVMGVGVEYPQPDGKIYHSGTVFRIDISGTTPIYKVLYDAPCIDSFCQFNPNSNLIQGSDGKFYGTVKNSDGLGKDRLYRLDVSGTTPVFTDLYDFEGETYGLVQGRDGKFYGSAPGGNDNQGTLVQLDTSGSTPIYSVVYDFDSVNARPSKLIAGMDGKLYGSVYPNNIHSSGAVIQIDISGTTPIYTVIHEFGGIDGQNVNNLVQASDGDWYGTTESGGQYGGGVIFRINLNPKSVNTAPVAANDSYKLAVPKHNKPVVVAAPGVLKNDKDGEGDKLTVVGSTANKPRMIVLPKGVGRVALYADGHFVYTQAKKGFYGSRSFTYQATDGKAASNPATVTLTLRNHH